MQRKYILAGAAIICLVSGVLVITFFPSFPKRSPPHVTVSGAHILEKGDYNLALRAKSVNVSIHLVWNESEGHGCYSTTVTNIAADRIIPQSQSNLEINVLNETSIKIDVCTASEEVGIYLTMPPKSEFNFLVFGDSQGYQGGLNEIASIVEGNLPAFAFHCGDLTPFGQRHQYEEVYRALQNISIPVFTTAGNHDVRLDGGEIYEEIFGSSTYSFDYSNCHFAVVNSSNYTVPSDELNWLGRDLSASQKPLKFVFTHVPPFDPRPGSIHSMTNQTSANRLMDIVKKNNASTVFTGHIHLYNSTIRNGTRYVISGGSGARLVADPQNGGFHHFINVSVSGSSVSMEPIELSAPAPNLQRIMIRNDNDALELSLQDIMSLPQIEEYSSFQNNFGNWRGQGIYTGPTIANLIELVGDMAPGDTLRVESSDGYSQNYSYSNVYPNSSWSELQGSMILAYSYNGTPIPEWDEGMRIAMLPPDGKYSNDDCLATSCPDMGCNVYLSAGARWIKYVASIEVIQDDA